MKNKFCNDTNAVDDVNCLQKCNRSAGSSVVFGH